MGDKFFVIKGQGSGFEGYMLVNQDAIPLHIEVYEIEGVNPEKIGPDTVAVEQHIAEHGRKVDLDPLVATMVISQMLQSLHEFR